MGHQCCSKQKVKRGLWSPEEDEKLVNYITTHGHTSWSSIPKHAGLQRCGKSCRLRWINYLRPDLKRGSFTQDEERTIIEVHRILGNRWAQIAKHLQGRTDNEVKNYWNSCIKKKLLAQGLDPNTHNILSSHQKKSKKQNPNNNNITNCTTTTYYPHIPSNSTSLAFSLDYDSPVHIIRQAIQSCFPSSNNEQLHKNVNSTNNDNKMQNFSTKNANAMQNSSKLSSTVNSNVKDHAWNDSIIIENMEQQQPLAQMDVIMQSQPLILSDNVGVEDEYGMVKNLHLNNQWLDDTLTTFNSPSFDVGYGDYSSIIMSGSLYSDIGSLAMDQVAWGNC